MKTKRNLIQLCLLALPLALQAQLIYTPYAPGLTSVTGYNPAAGPNVVIPTTANGSTVTTIGGGAFQSVPITSLSIPSTLTNIALQAILYCHSLTNISVDAANPTYSSLNGVLSDKAKATLIQFPGGLGGNYTIPNSVTNIAQQAFYYCTNLTSVTISNSVTSIGGQAFYYCFNLTNISVAVSNPTYSSLNGVLFDKAKATLIQFPGGLGGNYTIPNSVTSIGGAFSSCSKLMSITIGNSVTSIGSTAFIGCASLTNATIPNSVTSIGSQAFFVCTSLKNVTIGTGLTTIGSQAFFFCTALTGVYFQGNSPTPTNDTTVFQNVPGATAYYLLGNTGWGATFDGIPTAVYGVAPPPPSPPTLAISTYSNQPAVFFPTATGTNFVLQMTTNLSTGPWVTVSNGVPISGFIISNPPAKAFFRLH